MTNSERIEVFQDNKLILEPINVNEVASFVRNWIAKTPFWEITQIRVNYYKKHHHNKDYANRHNRQKEPTVKEVVEKNLMFGDDKRKYKCLRCGEESEVCGFCQVCYNKVYGLEDKEPIKVKIDDIVCNDAFICVVENDKKYTRQIRESIIAEGMKNPIILDAQNKILIGHHRYYIAKELGWEYIDVLYNPIDFGHGYFYEGKGYNLYICRIDGVLVGNTTDFEDILSLIKDFDASENGMTLTAEFFINIGSDIRLRDVFIPERGHIVDQTWKDWWLNKFGKDPR